MEVSLLVNILIAIIHALAHYSLLPFLHNIRYQQTDSLFSMWMNSETLKNLNNEQLKVDPLILHCSSVLHLSF
jgi:hypothetical protein